MNPFADLVEQKEENPFLEIVNPREVTPDLAQDSLLPGSTLVTGSEAPGQSIQAPKADFIDADTGATGAMVDAHLKRLSENRDKAANIAAMAAMGSMSESIVNDYYDDMNTLKDQPESYRFIPQVAMTAGLLAAPIAATIGGVARTIPFWKYLLGFGAFEAEEQVNAFVRSQVEGTPFKETKPYSLADVSPEDATGASQTALSIIDMLAKGKAIHSGYRGLKALWEPFTKDVLVEHGQPQRVYVDANLASDVMRGVATSEQRQIWNDLGVTASELRQAKGGGFQLEIPTEKLIHIADKPLIADLKKLIRVTPYEETRAEPATGERKVTPIAGLLGEGGEPATQAMDFFQSKGWTKEQAAGIVGNLAHESGGLKPEIVGDSGKSLGLAQWNAERRQGLMAYAATKGETAPSFQTQLEYVQRELETSESAAANALAKAKTPAEAAQVFSEQFERPGVPMLERRVALAESAYSGALKGAPGGAPIPQPRTGLTSESVLNGMIRGNVDLVFAGPSAMGWEGAPGKFSNLYDRKPMMEIDDEGAKIDLPKLNSLREGYQRDLFEILDHEELYKNYPELRNVKVIYDENKSEASFQTIGADEIIIVGKGSMNKQTLLHEIQHAIQEREGWARGGSPNWGLAISADKWLPEWHLRGEVKELMDQGLGLDQIKSMYSGLPESKDIPGVFKELSPGGLFETETQQSIKANIERLKGLQDPEEQYQRLFGEYMARDTASRANLNPEERLRTMPLGSEPGMTPDKMIYRYGSKGETSASIDNQIGQEIFLPATPEQIRSIERSL